MIRRATREDTQIVASLALKLWDKHNLDDLKSEFESILTTDNATIFLWFDNDVAVAFVQCQLRHDYVEGTSSSPVGYLEGIYVEPEYRRKGISKDLLNYCQEWSQGKGCTEFASDCELSNIDSYKFHLNAGFIEANRIICFKKKL